MKKFTCKALLWSGAVLVLLPTILVIATFFQPREYQSSVSSRWLRRPQPNGCLLSLSRDTLYLILFLIGIYLPGVALILTALLGRSGQLKAGETSTI